MDGVRIRDWRWWWGIMGNYWLEVGHMIWSPYQVYPDLWSPQPPPPTYRRHPAHDDAVSGDDTAIDPMTSYMTGAMTDAMTDPLTPKTEPMPDPISESLTDPMRDPRTSLKTDPKADAWLAPSSTPRSRPWLWSWPKVENCDFRTVLSYWSCIQLPYLFFSPSNYFATFLSPKWLFSLWPFQWKISSQRIKPMNILGHTGWDLSSLAPTREVPPATSTALCLAWHSQCTLPSK